MSQHLEFLGLDWIRNLESNALEKKPHSVALCWSRITRYGERTPILLQGLGGNKKCGGEKVH